MSYTGYEKLNPSDILQSDDYIGNDFDYGFAHWKYIDKIKTSKGWRYIYKKTKSAGKTIKKGASNAADSINESLGAKKRKEMKKAELAYEAATSDPKRGRFNNDVESANRSRDTTEINRNIAERNLKNSKRAKNKYGVPSADPDKDRQHLNDLNRKLNKQNAAKKIYDDSKKEYDKTVYGTVDRIRKKFSKRW